MIPIIIVFVFDFDGTITTHDIGEFLLAKYSFSDKWKEWDKKMFNGEVDFKVGYQEQYTLLKANLTDIQNAIKDIVPDSFVHTFFERAENAGIPVIIASDGFDVYIKPYLSTYFPELRNYKIYSNHAEQNDEGKWEITFPFTCPKNDTHGCALCKIRIVVEEQLKGSYVIYIGDGISDFRPSLKSDQVYAKKDQNLEKFLKERNFPFQTYNDFNDIIQQLTVQKILN